MRGWVLALGAGALLAASQAAWAADPQGAIRLCRRTDLVAPAQRSVSGEAVRLQPWAAFDDYGPIPGDATRRWPLTVITVGPINLLPRQACATVAAIISPVSKVRSVKPSDRRHLEFGGFVRPDGNEDPNAKVPAGYEKVMDLEVTIAAPFR